jgi:excisionase family DNA binding protein
MMMSNFKQPPCNQQTPQSSRCKGRSIDRPFAASSAPNNQIDQLGSIAPSEEAGAADKRETAGSPFLTVPEAADYLRVSKNYLDKLRVTGGGPMFFRLGRKKVVYRRDDLSTWISARRFGSTTEYAEQADRADH